MENNKFSETFVNVLALIGHRISFKIIKKTNTLKESSTFRMRNFKEKKYTKSTINSFVLRITHCKMLLLSNNGCDFNWKREVTPRDACYNGGVNIHRLENVYKIMQQSYKLLQCWAFCVDKFAKALYTFIISIRFDATMSSSRKIRTQLCSSLLQAEYKPGKGRESIKSKSVHCSVNMQAHSIPFQSNAREILARKHKVKLVTVLNEQDFCGA